MHWNTVHVNGKLAPAQVVAHVSFDINRTTALPPFILGTRVPLGLCFQMFPGKLCDSWLQYHTIFGDEKSISPQESCVVLFREREFEECFSAKLKIRGVVS